MYFIAYYRELWMGLLYWNNASHHRRKPGMMTTRVTTSTHAQSTHTTCREWWLAVVLCWSETISNVMALCEGHLRHNPSLDEDATKALTENEMASTVPEPPCGRWRNEIIDVPSPNWWPNLECRVDLWDLCYQKKVCTCTTYKSYSFIT